MRWLDTSDIDTGNVDRRLGDEGIDAIIVPGGFGERGVEGKIACVEYVRRKRIPYLGICLGFQMAVIEYARHVLGLDGANSTEFDDGCAHPVIAELPEQKKIEGLGGTMRLGAHEVLVEPNTLAWLLFEPGDAATIRQRFRHRWEVEPAYIDRLVAAGLRFSGRHPRYPIMQVLELDQAVHPYFIAAQFHPELTSRPITPAPDVHGPGGVGDRPGQPDAGPDGVPARGETLAAGGRQRRAPDPVDRNRAAGAALIRLTARCPLCHLTPSALPPIRQQNQQVGDTDITVAVKVCRVDRVRPPRAEQDEEVQNTNHPVPVEVVLKHRF